MYLINVVLVFLFLIFFFVPILFIQNGNIENFKSKKGSDNKYKEITVKRENYNYIYFLDEKNKKNKKEQILKVHISRSKKEIDIDYKNTNNPSFDLEERNSVHYLLKNNKTFFNMHIRDTNNPIKIIEDNHKKSFSSKKESDSIDILDDKITVATISDFNDKKETFTLKLNKNYNNLIIPLITANIIRVENKDIERHDFHSTYAKLKE